MVMKANSLCSMRFHLLVPGGCAQSPSPAIPQRPRYVRPHAPHLPRTTAALARPELAQAPRRNPDGIDVNHPVRITAPAAGVRKFPDSFVAFLSVSRFFSA